MLRVGVYILLFTTPRIGEKKKWKNKNREGKMLKIHTLLTRNSFFFHILAFLFTIPSFKVVSHFMNIFFLSLFSCCRRDFFLHGFSCHFSSKASFSLDCRDGNNTGKGKTGKIRIGEKKKIWLLEYIPLVKGKIHLLSVFL